MKVDKIYKLIDELIDVNDYNNSGGTNGLYLLFSQWKEDSFWSFVQSYLTKEGFVNMIKTSDKEILEKQNLKLMFANGNTHEFIELFNTKEVDDDENN